MASPLSEETDPPELETEIPRYRPQIQSLNIETNEQRFPRSGGVLGPNIAAWRCNLAALSQRRNLLFTAHETDIYVWIPTGPRQLLGSQPEMVIHPLMKAPHAPGYINHSKPHTINHIVLDDLGVNEILLLATDSGNVTGYHVEPIFSAINQGTKDGLSRPFNANEVKPFFAESVGMSAWGLAIHKFARLIAVSANTGIITVFAFALVDIESESDDSMSSQLEDSDLDLSDSTWISIDTASLMEELKKDIPNHRTRNLRLSYKGHFDNIPCVSFANFELDPNGLWMVSTDIDNRVFVWKVWGDLAPIRISSYDVSGADREQRGWFVLPIHPRRVQQHRLMVDACGCEPHPRMIKHRLVFDVSEAATHVANRSIIPAEKYTESTPIALPHDIFDSDFCVDSESPSQTSRSERGHSALEALGTAADHIHVGFDESETELLSPHHSLRVRRGLTDLIEEENEHESTWRAAEPSVLRFHTSHPINPQFFPILHFSGHDISLSPYPMDNSIRTISQSPLRSLTEGSMFMSCDRLNMVKYLPDLGIVVVATQSGGVAIITLTWQEYIGHTFRVDWLLPFVDQQKNDGIMTLPLMGIAVSPMPGFEMPPDVPCIPRDVDPKDWLKFNWRLLNPEKDEPYDADEPEANLRGHNDPEFSTGTEEFEENSPRPSDTSFSPEPEETNFTLPELHAHASSIYRPRESWHGCCPSRHYRLLLLFCDLSVMSYEFWHDWRA